MRFLKTLFWLLLGGVVTAFVLYNSGERVSIRLWADMIADFSLPLLMILVFLAGLLPMLLAYHAFKWRMRQRIAGLERALADLHAITAPEPADAAPLETFEAAPKPAQLTEAS